MLREPHPRAGRVSTRWLALFGALALAALAAYWSVTYRRNVCDDALISLQYARNLANGHGLVFNLGERVEGYTNFLWVGLLAALFPLSHLGLDFVHVATGASIALAAADVALVVAVGRILWGNRWLPALFAVGLCLADNAYSVWAIQALEGHLLLFWMLLSLWLLWGTRLRARALWAGLCLAAAVMTRPDAALFAVSVVGSEALAVVRRPDASTGLRRDGLPASARTWLAVAGASALVYGAYFLWRYEYFGFLLPNTFYLKAEGLRGEAFARGREYVTSFAQERAWVPLLALASILFVRSRLVLALLGWLVLHTAYVVYVGGDFYPGHRFLLVAIPVCGLLGGRVVAGLQDALASGLGRIGPRARRAGDVLAWTAVAATLALLTERGLELGPAKTEIARWGARVDATKRFMEWLGARRPEGASIVAGDIGSAGYYAGLHVYDYYGVIDPEVAHKKAARFGTGKAGHEKRATPDAMLAKGATYIKEGYVPGDLHTRGYYLDTALPRELGIPGIWVRDELASGDWERVDGFDFPSGGYPDWEASGDAFRKWPVNGTAPGQNPTLGASGSFVSTFVPGLGDRAKGTLRSPPFTLEGDVMVLRVAGGEDAERLRVSLLVDGAVVRTTTGSGTEYFGRRRWDLEGLRGGTAVLEIVDDSSGGWGHIMVDEISQWRRVDASSARPGQLNDDQPGG